MRGPMIHRETVSTGEVEWFDVRAILDRSSAGYGLAVGINGKGVGENGSEMVPFRDSKRVIEL